MAADITDKFSKIISGTTRPVATTLSAQKLIGATTASLTAATGWDTDTAVHGIMYRTDAGTGAKVTGSQIDWKATLSGTTLSNFTVTAGTDDTYAIGATVELAPTAAWGDDLVTGLLVEHNQDGTHGDINADSVTAATGKISTTAVSKLEDAGTPLSTYRANYLYDFVYSGGVWSGDSYGSTRNASMTAMVCYINGRRISISAVTARSFTASKDTYVDVLDNADGTGTLVYTEATNNAASPALAANSIRIAIIVTGASNIANAGSVNQGEESKVLPIASSIPYAVTDSLGNLICPRDPQRRIIGYRQLTTAFTGTATTLTDITGLNLVCNIPANRKIRVSMGAMWVNSSSAAGMGVTVDIYDVTDAAQADAYAYSNPVTGYATNATHSRTYTPAASGTRNFKMRYKQDAAGTFTYNAGAATPAYLMVELV